MADAQYAIDIAAEFDSAGQTEAQLDALSEKLMGGGINAKFFRDAVDTVNAKLAAASNATRAASAALDESSARYSALEKTSVQAQKAAERAALKHADALDKLQKASTPQAAARAASAVDRHAQAMREAQAAANLAKGALDSEAVTLKRVEAAANGAAQAERKLKGQLQGLGKLQKRVNDRLGDAATNLSTFRGALGDVGGPLGEFGERLLFPAQAFVDLKEKFSASTAAITVGVVGIAAVTAALAAMAAVAATAAIAVAAVGVKLADNARKAGLAKEAFKALHPELAGVVDGFRGITKTTGVAEGRLTEITKQLKAAKVAAADIPAALRAAATAEAALGAGGADKFIEDIKTAKKNVGELANDVQSKFGGIVSRQLLGLEAQGARLKSNMGRLFGGLDIDPLLEKLRIITDMFDENTVIGKTLKKIWEGLFQPIVDGFTKALPLAEAFFLGVLISAVKTYIFFKPLIKAVKELLGFDDPTTADTFKKFTEAGKIAGVILVAAFGAITAVIAVLVAGIAQLALILATPLIAVVALGVGLYKFAKALPDIASAVGEWATSVKDWIVESFNAAATWVSEKVTAVKESIVGAFDAVTEFLSGISLADLGLAIVSTLTFGVSGAVASVVAAAIGWWPDLKAKLSEIDLSQIGADLIAGLVKGITAGAGAVVSAVSGAVGGAVSKAKSLLGISSPSKVFAEIGVNTGEGFTRGVEDEASNAQKAMADMVAPPALTALAPANDVTAPAVEVPRSRFGSRSVVDLTEDGQRASADAGRPSPAGSNSVNLDGVSFNFYGVEGAEQAEQRLRETLVKLFEGELTQAGGKAA